MKMIDLYAGLSGKWLATVPEQCVEEIGSARGQVDNIVAAWVADKRITWGDLRDIRADLRGHGAWDDLYEVSEDTLRGRCLWTACSDEWDDQQHKNENES